MHIKPGIRLPPPVIYLAALLTGIVLDSLWAMSPLPGSWRYIVGSLLIVVNLLIMPPVLRRFCRAGTTFDVRKVASVLITDGPYRFSRNPSYVSLTLLYVGEYYPQQRLELAIGSTRLTGNGPVGGE